MPAESIVYNADCVEAMKQMPDNAFDLAVVDPPYGDALHVDGGGSKGWFEKYSSHVVQVERERESKSWNRFGGRFDRYKPDIIPTEEEKGKSPQNGSPAKKS